MGVGGKVGVGVMVYIVGWKLEFHESQHLA